MNFVKQICRFWLVPGSYKVKIKMYLSNTWILHSRDIRLLDIIILSIVVYATSLSELSDLPRVERWLQSTLTNVGKSLNVLDKCRVCKGANLISMVWNFKGITCCNCSTRESINHCSVRSSCNFFPNAGIYFHSILFFFTFNLTRSFERLIAAIFKNNKLF